MLKMVEETLKSHNIRPTVNRRSILKLFLESSFALSHGDIEQWLGSRCDRVTIYRTLETFVEHGLIHKISDETNVMKYALCGPDRCSLHRHDDRHLHFQCRKCGHTFCLPLIKIPDVAVPEGYQLQTLSMTAEGLCRECASKN